VRDRNFQGFGRFVTGSSGEHLFRTIRPVPYPGRTPHIHVAVKLHGREKFSTQCYIQGEPQNEKDRIYRSVQDSKQRAAITVPFLPLRGSLIGELTARFDIRPAFLPQA
jgi:protocatechuate 3,4-dioxygenase beta subunit